MVSTTLHPDYVEKEVEAARMQGYEIQFLLSQEFVVPLSLERDRVFLTTTLSTRVNLRPLSG
jgi:hypothetical protein